MRRDMADVLKERRHRRYEQEKYWSRVRINRADPDDIPTRVSFGRSWIYSNGSVNPLEKFLRSKLGELWDDVYSEICAATDRRSFRGHSLFKQLGWMVETSARERRWRGFYVDKERRLRYWEHRKRQPKFEPITRIPTNNPDEWYELISGCWFLMEREERVDKSTFTTEWLDWENGEVVIKSEFREYHHERTILTKRQVGKRTLKNIRKILREMEEPSAKVESSGSVWKTGKMGNDVRRYAERNRRKNGRRFLHSGRN